MFDEARMCKKIAIATVTAYFYVQTTELEKKGKWGVKTPEKQLSLISLSTKLKYL